MKRILTIVLAVILLVTLTSSVYATGSDGNSGRHVVLNPRAIVIIPGLGGTTLENENSYDVWPDVYSMSALACREDGTSINNLTPVIASSAYGAHSVYENLYNELVDEFGLRYDILFLSYDWRMSNDEAIETLEEWIDMFDYQEIILVAHSMGGLVASSFLKNSEYSNLVDKVITIGTPYLGAPAVLHALETGQFFDIDYFVPPSITDDDYRNAVDLELCLGTMRTFNNFPSIYETLPIERGFWPYIRVDDSLLDLVGTQNFLQNCAWGKQSDGSPKQMFNDAIDFHNSLMYNGKHITDLTGYDVYRIYGTGTDTIEQCEYRSSGQSSNYQYRGPILNAIGDGVVPSTSATNNFSTMQISIPFNGVSHNELIDPELAPNVFACIVQIINDTYNAARSAAPEANDRGWLIGYDNKRITVVVDGPGSYLEILSATTIQTADGQQVVRQNNKLYLEQADGTRTEVGTIWQAGSESAMFFMRNENFVFSVNTQVDSVRVEYSDSGYYEKVLTYDTSNASSATVSVSNYDSKNVTCVRNGAGLSAVVSPTELPQDQLFDYKNPNK